MSAGELRHRVTFAKPNSVADNYGNVTTGWQAMFTVSANITPRLGGKSVEAARLAGRQPAIVRVRQSPQTITIRTNWKLTDVRTGAEYDIRTIADPDKGNVEHGKFLDMLAETGVAV